MMDNDPSGFYESIIDYFPSEEVKTSIKKFGITENLKKYKKELLPNVSFTEYPNPFDGTHTDLERQFIYN